MPEVRALELLVELARSAAPRRPGRRPSAAAAASSSSKASALDLLDVDRAPQLVADPQRDDQLASAPRSVSGGPVVVGLGRDVVGEHRAALAQAAADQPGVARLATSVARRSRRNGAPRSAAALDVAVVAQRGRPRSRSSRRRGGARRRRPRGSRPTSVIAASRAPSALASGELAGALAQPLVALGVPSGHVAASASASAAARAGRGRRAAKRPRAEVVGDLGERDGASPRRALLLAVQQRAVGARDQLGRR